MARLTKTERMLQQQNDGFLEREKKKKVQEIFDKMVIRINREINFSKFKKTYFPNEDRTMEFVIEGMEELDTGFVFKDGKVRTIKKLRDIPTVKLECSEDVFLQLASEEISFAQAYFYDWMKVTGENYIRDVELLKRMFNKYGHIMRR